MVLNNVRLINNGAPASIQVAGKKIVAVKHEANNKEIFQLHFDSALAFPGLINSHDHLDFNCFPQMGNRVYESYVEWGNTILQSYKTKITEVLSIPKPLRVQWGVYKNLLAGVTTVVNHGKYLKIPYPLINVLQKAQSLHSVEFENHWKLKLNNPLLKYRPCVIHAGEGTTVAAGREIDDLLKYNLLKRNLIAIHGVAMNEKQASKFKALVWCPESNNYLLRKTASIDKIKNFTQVCFGSDSTLTGNWNIWDHLRHARNLKLVNDAELLEMLTVKPAAVWDLRSGIISEKMDADIVIAETENNSLDSFYSVNPDKILMIMQQGNIRLFDKKLHGQLKKAEFDLADFSEIVINGRHKYIQGDLPGLIKDIRKYTLSVNFPISEN